MAMQYKIKTATGKNICSHLEACSKYFIPPLDCRVNLQKFSDKIYQKAVTFEVWDNEILVGMVSAYFNDSEKRTGFINNVSIIKEYMGIGIASELLDMCIEYAKKINFKEINLEVSKDNARAIHLYEKKSFRIYEDSGSFLIMKYELESHEST